MRGLTPEPADRVPNSVMTISARLTDQLDHPERHL